MDLLAIDLVDGPPPVLHVHGEIDLATAGALRNALATALATHDGLVVDMSETSFIDVAGLRAILEAAQDLNGRGPLRLVHAAPVARLLDLVGIRGVPSILIGDSA